MSASTKLSELGAFCRCAGELLCSQIVGNTKAFFAPLKALHRGSVYDEMDKARQQRDENSRAIWKRYRSQNSQAPR